MSKQSSARSTVKNRKSKKLRREEMFEVVYYSMGGNTRKVAEAIADELGVTAKEVKSVNSLPEDAFIFLGTGCYGAVLPGDIAGFIERNQLKGRKIALFTTSAFGWGKEVSVMEKQIRDKGVNIAGRFNCYGQFLAMKRGHPDREDLEKARQFVRSMAFKEYPQIIEIQPLSAATGVAN
jgi:flavodoxin